MPDKKISELSFVPSPITGDDVGLLVRDDTDHQFTFEQLRNYIVTTLAIGSKIYFVSTLPQNTDYNNGDVAINTTNSTFYQKRNGTWVESFTLPQANNSSGANLLYGLGEPNASTGQLNQTYINTANGKFYQKTAGGWSQVFSMLNGPPGGPGPKGDTGSAGINGKTLLSGTVDPSNQTTGTDGDFYINTTTWIIFGPKTNSNWGAGKPMTQDILELGNVSLLKTTKKTNAVEAINELWENKAAPAWKVYGNVPFGKYTNSMTVPEAINAYSQYKEAYQNVNAPIYTRPSVGQTVSAKITATQAGIANNGIEVGQVIDFSINPAYTNNSAGGLVDGSSVKPLIITKKIGSAAAVEIGNTDPTENLNNVITAESIVFTTVYNYNGAPIKKNDADEPDSRGQFAAGSTTPESTTITPRYRIFYGTLPSDALPTSDLLRGVAGQASIVNSVFENGAATLSLNTGTTHQHFFLAVRTSFGRTLLTAKDVQTNGDVKSIYLSGKITMNIKNGGTGDVSYDIYIYKQAVPYLS